MVDVNENNFQHWLPKIQCAIDSAAFIAVDFEFLGLPSTSHPRDVSLFDTPEQRYLKLRDSVRRFPACQMGLACFREKVDGYEVEVYTIPLFKRMAKQVSSFSLGAMSFLSQHNFDFNKLVAEGVTYCNGSELDSLRQDIVSGQVDYDRIVDGLSHRLQMLKTRILMEAADSPALEDGSPASCLGVVHLTGPLKLSLSSKGHSDTEAGCASQSSISAEETLWNRPLTTVEAAIVVHVLNEEFPLLEVNFDDTRCSLHVTERISSEDTTTEQARNSLLLNSLLAELSGAGQVFRCLSEKRPILVGHNSLLDLLYLYQSFEADLPDSYEKWKKAMSSVFPLIIDTKILATSLQEKLYAKGVTDVSLQTLGAYFDSASSRVLLPFEIPEVYSDEQFQSVLGGSENYHNAGFDALMTGKVFVKLAHLYAHSARPRSSSAISDDWPLRKLVLVLRSSVVNRVPIPLIDTQHCYLAGADPTGARPDIIRVGKRRNLSWFSSLTHVESVPVWTDRLMSKLVPCKLMGEEYDELRGMLTRAFGSFRVEVRLESGLTSLSIATNTPNTFARVCSFFTSHDDYYLLDEMDVSRKSYDERLCASRHQKDTSTDTKKFSRSYSRASLLLIVIVAGCLIGRQLRGSKY